MIASPGLDAANEESEIILFLLLLKTFLWKGFGYKLLFDSFT